MPLAAKFAPALIALEAAVLAVWWRPALAPAAVLVVAAAAVRRRGRSLPRWLAVRAAWRSRRRTGWDEGGPAAVLDRLDVAPLRVRGEDIAVVGDGLGCAVVLALDAPGPLVGGPREVPWSLLADTLADAVEPAAVQAVADAENRIWLAIRVSPAGSPDAVARRGGGQDGCRRAARAVALRTAARLCDAGHPARPLDEAETRTVLRAATYAAELAEAREAWQGWRSQNTSVHLSLARRPIANWRSVTLVPHAGPDRVACRILITGSTADRSLMRLDGQHGPALFAAAPLARQTPEFGPPLALDRAALGKLGAIASPKGMPLGYDRDGNIRSALLHRSAPTDIVLVGGVRVAAELLRRAGVPVTVVTRRPQDWDLPEATRILSPDDPVGNPAGPTAPALVLWDEEAAKTKPPWCATVTRIGDLTPRTAAPLAAADLALAHHLTEDQAKVFAAALGLTDRQAHWLARSPEDGLAAVDGDRLTFLALGASEATPVSAL